MNAEYTHSGNVKQFEVQAADGGVPPPTAKITERSTCGKFILERSLVIDAYDVERKVAVYSLVATGKRLA